MQFMPLVSRYLVGFAGEFAKSYDGSAKSAEGFFHWPKVFKTDRIFYSVVHIF